MDGAEQIVTDLLIAIARAQGVLREAHAELEKDPVWSDLTYGLSPGEYNLSRDDPNARLRLSGWLCGQLANVGQVEWQVEVFRPGEGSGWIVDRWVNTWLPEREPPELARLPDVECTTSAQLASELPRLVAELLTLAPPHPGAQAS